MGTERAPKREKFSAFSSVGGGVRVHFKCCVFFKQETSSSNMTTTLVRTTVLNKLTVRKNVEIEMNSKVIRIEMNNNILVVCFRL